MSHTKGPWENRDYAGACHPSVYGPDGAVVATCGGKHRSNAEKSDNARLIAAAPELLELAEAHERLLAAIYCHGLNHPETAREEDNVRRRRAAIAKARGEKP